MPKFLMSLSMPMFDTSACISCSISSYSLNRHLLSWSWILLSLFMIPLTLERLSQEKERERRRDDDDFNLEGEERTVVFHTCFIFHAFIVPHPSSVDQMHLFSSPFHPSLLPSSLVSLVLSRIFHLVCLFPFNSLLVYSLLQNLSFLFWSWDLFPFSCSLLLIVSSIFMMLLERRFLFCCIHRMSFVSHCKWEMS